MLKAAFIIESEDSAAAHYRVLANIAAFEREGVDVYPLVLPVSLKQRRKLFRDLDAFDAVVLQRRLVQPWEFLMLRRHADVLGYDFDDALLYRDRAEGRFGSFSRRVKFSAIVRGVDFVTAGNAYLASLAGGPSERVSIVPTPVDTAQYKPAERQGGPVRIGWIGSHSTVKYLEGIMPALERVVAARPGVTLTVVSNSFPPERPFIRDVKWHRDTEPAEVAAFDIGIMPLPDNPWTRGKCGFKLLLYGASGVASIASPVGANCDIVVGGETGLLASTPDDWERSLLSLIDDPSLRQAIGRAARSRVEKLYSTEVVVRSWANILKSKIAHP